VGNTYQYDAFGAPIASTGTIANTYLYSGERFDSNLNLYQLRARFYNMLTGRFEAADPHSGKITDPATLHRYAYAANNPVNRIDPTGKDIEAEEIGIYKEVVEVANPIGEEGHHLLQKRFACLLGEAAGAMLAAQVDPNIHQLYDNLWNDEIPYGTTSCATTEDVIAAALEIYDEDPAVLEWLTNYYQLQEIP